MMDSDRTEFEQSEIEISYSVGKLQKKLLKLAEIATIPNFPLNFHLTHTLFG